MQASEWSSVLGIPLYVWGTVYFVVVVGGLLRRAQPRWPRWLRGLTVTGGLGGAGLLALQAFSIGAWCPWCLCVDLAAIGLAVLAIVGAPLGVQLVALLYAPGEGFGRLFLALGGLALVVLLAALRLPSDRAAEAGQRA